MTNQLQPFKWHLFYNTNAGKFGNYEVNKLSLLETTYTISLETTYTISHRMVLPEELVVASSLVVVTPAKKKYLKFKLKKNE